VEPRPWPKGSAAEADVIAERYRLRTVLGEGATGTVFVAEVLRYLPGAADRGEVERGLTRPGQDVALKVIHRHLASDYQINRRFCREARILSRLRSPNLVPLLDFGETEDGQLYMALELVRGRSLEEVLRDGPLAPARAVAVAEQICAALEDAHAAGVVHRDLKPSNVIIEPEADGVERVRVLDFGMAKLVRGELTESLNALTEQNMVFGTPEYMAPEQARGDQSDARTDVYAVGVILYEMITGSVPFSSNTPIGMMTAHLLENPEPPSSRAPHREIAAALEAVVLHSLAKRARDRYPTAAALRAALRHAWSHPSDVASTLPPPAPEDDLGTRETEHALRLSGLRPTEPAAAAALLAAADGAEERPSRAWVLVAVVAALIGVAAGILVSLMGRT
jgi:eukaryotic-like serine/threonine-protein kinase